MEIWIGYIKTGNVYKHIENKIAKNLRLRRLRLFMAKPILEKNGLLNFCYP